MASHSPDLIQGLAIKETRVSAQTYQVGAHFEALNEPILVAASKTFDAGSFRYPLSDCANHLISIKTWTSHTW